jgi:hypothetical protein
VTASIFWPRPASEKLQAPRFSRFFAICLNGGQKASARSSFLYCAHSYLRRPMFRACASRSSHISVWDNSRDAVLTGVFLRLSGSAALATGAVDGRATSGETDTTTASATRSEHGRVPVGKFVSSCPCSFLQHFSAYLSISGTINRRTCEPRMYTRSR